MTYSKTFKSFYRFAMPATAQTLRIQLLITALSLTAFQYAFAQNQPALTLTIVPTTYANNPSSEPALSFSHPDHFYVLLANNSSTSVNIFEEWNSWGYYGLSFEITYPDGRKVQWGKAARDWFKNFPSTTTIAPHGYYVFSVDFGEEWDYPLRTTSKSEHGFKCSIQAIYSISRPSDKLLDDFDSVLTKPVWSGTIRSEESAYIIYP